MVAMSTDLARHFQLTQGGSYMERYGPATEQLSNKKLCLVATDLGALLEVLYELSLREECHYVKYSVTAKDGMHLGRCFLNSDELTGELWKQFKQHPKLLCSVQDDDFILPHRGIDFQPRAEREQPAKT